MCHAGRKKKAEPEAAAGADASGGGSHARQRWGRRGKLRGGLAGCRQVAGRGAFVLGPAWGARDPRGPGGVVRARCSFVPQERVRGKIGEGFSGEAAVLGLWTCASRGEAKAWGAGGGGRFQGGCP